MRNEQLVLIRHSCASSRLLITSAPAGSNWQGPFWFHKLPVKTAAVGEVAFERIVVCAIRLDSLVQRCADGNRTSLYRGLLMSPRSTNRPNTVASASVRRP